VRSGYFSFPSCGEPCCIPVIATIPLLVQFEFTPTDSAEFGQGPRECRWPVFEMTWLILRPSALGNGWAPFVPTLASRRRWARHPTSSPKCFTCTADELSPGAHQRNELFLSKTELDAHSAQRAIRAYSALPGECKSHAIAAYHRLLTGEDYRPPGFRRDLP
jgi:hypothetical protein